MKVLDLFAGLKGWSEAFKDRGHIVDTLDNDPKFHPKFCMSVMDHTHEMIKGYDLYLASPPCECFSVARIGANWTPHPDNQPRNERARLMRDLALYTFKILEGYPYVLENPRAKLRVLAPYPPTATIWYCQYGDFRAKPTDIWTSIKELNWRPRCHNGAKDHEAAPRGAKTGTMGQRFLALRALIPYGLSLDVCLQMEALLK
jgi:hypothetical protein